MNEDEEPADDLVAHYIANLIWSKELANPDESSPFEPHVHGLRRAEAQNDLANFLGFPVRRANKATLVRAYGINRGTIRPLQQYALWSLMSQRLDNTHDVGIRDVDDWEVAGWMLLELLHDEMFIGYMHELWTEYGMGEDWAPNPWPVGDERDLAVEITDWIRLTWPAPQKKPRAEGYKDLMSHDGHNIQLAQFGAINEPPDNVAIVCEACQDVLLDFDRPDDTDNKEASDA